MKRRLSKMPVGMFGSESELVQTLIDAARAAGYQAHPELGSWDTVIACRETGDQIGVHGKLCPSVAVLAQALTDESGPGPDIHAVLVPVASRDFRAVAGHLGLHVFEGVSLDSLQLPIVFKHAKRWGHPIREWAPEFEINTPAGVPSPRRMTKWKVHAVRLSLLARSKGFVTTADMHELGQHPQWWVSKENGQILVPRLDETGKKRRGEYVLRDSTSQLVPHFRWPEITSALEEQERIARSKKTIPAQPKGPRLRQRRQPEAPAPRSTMLPPPPPPAADEDEEESEDDHQGRKGRLFVSGK